MSEWKYLGLALIFGVSAWTGFGAAARVRRMLRQLELLKVSLELMRCEISLRRTPFRRLCAILESGSRGELARFYTQLGTALLHGQSPREAVETAQKHSRLLLPKPILERFSELLASFGGYDLDGQLRLIELVQAQTSQELERLTAEKPARCRCYQTLGVCTGLALVILVA